MPSRARAGASQTLLFAGLGLLAVLLAAAFSKPQREQHLDALRAQCAESAGAVGAAGCEIALGAGALFGAVKFDDRVLFSELRAGDKTLSRGAFGMVWVIN
jgi:hypothetical protein